MIKKKHYNRLDVLDRSFNFKENVIKFGKNETFEHFLGKCLIAWELSNTNLDFYTEAIFKGKKRSDFFVLDWNQAIEIVKSESSKSIIEKESSYPVRLTVITTKKIFNDNKELLRKCLD